MLDDIDKQYEQIFGKEHYPNVFSDNDAEYMALRQEIIDSRREYNPKKKLPFAGVVLSSYEDFKKENIIRSAEKKGYRVFYLQRYVNKKLVVYAAGYFNPVSSVFVVLKGSFCQKAYYGIRYGKQEFDRNFDFDSAFDDKAGFMVQKKDVQYSSASSAASIFLGRNSSFIEWRDKRGKYLDSYFPYFRTVSVKENVNAVSCVNDIHISRSKSIIYYIRKDGINASGYFKDGYFYICKNSRVTTSVDQTYASSYSGKNRERFISEACVLIGNHYLVMKDAKCVTAFAAACYVLGTFATAGEWKNVNGEPFENLQ